MENHSIILRRQRDQLELKDGVYPLGSIDPEGSLFYILSVILYFICLSSIKGRTLVNIRITYQYSQFAIVFLWSSTLIG